jgi:drug/metabolite transporter (DMT)-like permease
MKADHMSNSLFGIGFGLAAVAGWAAYSIAGAAALLQGFTPGELGALRYIVPGIMLAPLLMTGLAGRLRSMGVLRILILGLLAGPLYGYAIMAGLTLAPLSHAVVLGPLGVMLSTLMIAIFTSGEMPTRTKLVGGLMVVAGVALVAGPTFKDPTFKDKDIALMIVGDVVFFLTGVAMGLFGFLSQRWQLAPLDTLAAVALFSTLVLLPFLPAIFNQPLARHGVAPFAIQVIMQGAIGGFLALLAYVYAIKFLGPLRASYFPALVPVTAIVASSMLGVETLTSLKAFGAAVATCGLAVAQLSADQLARYGAK